MPQGRNTQSRTARNGRALRLAKASAVSAVLALGLAGCAASPSLNDTAQAPAPGPKISTASIPLAFPGQGQGAAAPATSAGTRTGAPVKVGLLLPLTGPGQAAIIAETMKKAAELAVTERGASAIQLIIKDDKGTAEGADAGVRDIAKDGGEVVLGPLFARSVQAAAAPARQVNLPVVAFSNDRQVAGQNVSLLSFLPEGEVARVVAYAASRGKKRYIALIPDDSYGKIVETAFRAAVTRHNGEVVALETYPMQANGMLETVRRLRDAARGLEEHGDPIDALFLPGGEETLATLLPQLKQAQFDFKRIQVIGTGALDYANAGRDPQLLGAWFAASDPRGWQEFSQKFAKAYGHVPPRIASLAYDAAHMAIALASGPDGARFIPSQLNRPNGFSGADGAFRFGPDGTVERALAVLEVQQFNAKVIDAAPAAFGEGRQSTVYNATPAGGPRANPVN